VKGVGLLIALTFVPAVAGKERFQKSREVVCYWGLRPRRSQPGASEPELCSTKYLRKLLVQGAQYIPVRNGPGTDLKRWETRLAVVDQPPSLAVTRSQSIQNVELPECAAPQGLPVPARSLFRKMSLFFNGLQDFYHVQPCA
jgi:hypothetical protein